MNNFYCMAGIRIRKLREHYKYTREEFAEIVDISPKFLYEIEVGLKGFSADTLYRISKGLCVNCEYILTGNDENVENDEVLNLLRKFNVSQIKTIAELLNAMHKISTIDDTSV